MQLWRDMLMVLPMVGRKSLLPALGLFEGESVMVGEKEASLYRSKERGSGSVRVLGKIVRRLLWWSSWLEKLDLTWSSLLRAYDKVKELGLLWTGRTTMLSIDAKSNMPLTSSIS
jgi:hypothetical protein